MANDQDLPAWCRITWRSEAPATLRSAAKEADEAAFVKELHRHWFSMPEHKGGTKRSQRALMASLWKVAPGGETTEPAAFPAIADAVISGDFPDDLAELLLDRHDAAALLAGLACLWGATRRITPELFATVWGTVWENATELLDATPVDFDGTDEQFVTLLIETAEIPFTVGATYSQLKGSRKRLKQGAKRLSEALEALTDTDGTPHAAQLPQLTAILASFGRATWIAEQVGVKLWNKREVERLVGLCGRAASLCTPGHHAFSTVESVDAIAVVDALAATVDLERKGALRRRLQEWAETNGAVPKKSRARGGDWSLPEASHQSDWASWASLRSGWDGSVDACLVDYHQPEPGLDLVLAGIPILTGSWSTLLRWNGKSVAVQDSWSCVCWFSDEEAEFIELEQSLDPGLTVVRQVLLARQDRCLLLSDSVRATEPGSLEYATRWELASDFEVARDTATREWALVHPDVRVRLFPIGLPQPRVEKANGALTCTQSDLSLSVQADATKGCRMPLLLSWAPSRDSDPVEWKSLTVAEDGQIQLPDAAAAARIRIGRKQWLSYHSMQPAQVGRTVLGVHTEHETVFGRISRQGEFDPLLQVESGA